MWNASRVYLLSTLKLCFAALFLLSVTASATDKPAVLDKKLNAVSAPLLQQCTTCHGNDLTGNLTLKSPALAGQAAWYITQQFEHFKQGIRGKHQNDIAGQQMAAISHPIPIDENFKKLANYIETLPLIDNKNSKDASIDLKQGNNYYQGKCGACHGGKAQGNKSLHAPRLNGFTTAYLTQQMSNFTQGIRGSDPQDKYGRQMAMMAKTTSGQELKNILAFIQTIRTSANEN